jgi:hypothetical protein
MIISNSTVILKLTPQLKKYQENTRRIPDIFLNKNTIKSLFGETKIFVHYNELDIICLFEMKMIPFHKIIN